MEHESHLPPSRVVRIRVVDPVLARAVEAVVVGAGWEVGCNGAGVVVGDATTAAADVVVVPPTPATCRDAVGWPTPASVVVTDRLDDLPDALAAAERGYVLVPQRVHALAGSLPCIEPRERRVLEALMAGQSNVRIARTLGISDATVKRIVAALVVRLGAARREELTAVALDLGFRPCRARP